MRIVGGEELFFEVIGLLLSESPVVFGGGSG
jgi:hypothetical protein